MTCRRYSALTMLAACHEERRMGPTSRRKAIATIRSASAFISTGPSRIGPALPSSDTSPAARRCPGREILRPAPARGVHASRKRRAWASGSPARGARIGIDIITDDVETGPREASRRPRSHLLHWRGRVHRFHESRRYPDKLSTVDDYIDVGYVRSVAYRGNHGIMTVPVENQQGAIAGATVTATVTVTARLLARPCQANCEHS